MQLIWPTWVTWHSRGIVLIKVLSMLVVTVFWGTVCWQTLLTMQYLLLVYQEELLMHGLTLISHQDLDTKQASHVKIFT